MKISCTSERLRKIMRENGLRQVDVLQKAQPYCNMFGVKLAKNDLSQYVNGKVDPGQEKLTILGLALNVNEAWLMGYDVPMERENQKEQPTVLDGLSLDNLSDLQKIIISEIIKMPEDRLAALAKLLGV